MSTRGIYKIINIINNKFYVGSAVHLGKRKSRHFSELRRGKHNNKHLQAAWNKYGEQAFIFVVLEYALEGEDLFEMENGWLRENVGTEYCYNIGREAAAPMLGMSGELSPTWGYKHTELEKTNIGNRSRGRLHTDTTKELIRSRLRGIPRSAETRAKLSLALRGSANWNYGKPRSPEFLAKVRHRILVTAPDGSKAEYASIKELRITMGVNPPTINRALKTGGRLSRGPYKGWVFKRVDPTAG